MDDSGNRLYALENISSSIDGDGNEVIHEMRSTSSLEVYESLP